MVASRKPSPFACLRWLIKRHGTGKIEPYLETLFYQIQDRVYVQLTH